MELSDFDLGAMKQRALALNPNIQIFELSAKTGQGIDVWADWLKAEVNAFVRI